MAGFFNGGPVGRVLPNVVIICTQVCNPVWVKCIFLSEPELKAAYGVMKYCVLFDIITIWLLVSSRKIKIKVISLLRIKTSEWIVQMMIKRDEMKKKNSNSKFIIKTNFIDKIYYLCDRTFWATIPGIQGFPCG
jgi:hypothetical protein